MEIDEIIDFGEYQWLVLAVEADRALLITEDIIGQRPYHNNSSEVCWATSEVRNYLNSDFYDSFDESSRQKLFQ